MKNNKGFTLIELLAVIVILAIIALIATPMILNVVQDAKDSAAEASTNGFIEAIENNNMLAEFDTDGSDYTVITGDAVYTVGDSATLPTVPLKGDTPTDGWVAIDEDGMVSSAVFYFDDIAASTTVVYVAGESTVTITYDVDDMDAAALTTVVLADAAANALQP